MIAERDIDVMDRLIDVAGKRIVDAGCGEGGLARALVERGAEVIALEPDPVQAATNRDELEGGAISFFEVGAEAMPVDDGCVDGVIFSMSLHHVPVALMGEAIGEAKRVLRPGGFLYVLEPEAGGSYTELAKPFHDESEERLAAEGVLKESTAGAFRSHEEVRFVARYSFDDFETFVGGVTSRNYNAISREAVDTPAVRAVFETARTATGYVFDQPMRVNLFTGRT